MIIYRELDMSNLEVDSKVLIDKTVTSNTSLPARQEESLTDNKISLAKQPKYGKFKLTEVAELVEANIEH